jgi:hypothetical protein
MIRSVALTGIAAFAIAAAPASAGTRHDVADHYAKREAVMWAYDQHRFPDRIVLGYRFEGCSRSAPSTFRCRIGIGYAYGSTGFVARTTVRVRVRGTAATVKWLRHTGTVAPVTGEHFATSIAP